MELDIKGSDAELDKVGLLMPHLRGVIEQAKVHPAKGQDWWIERGGKLFVRVTKI